ncbi:unnamed protein product [Citrullus colocynthis]|uniref:Uncharacterized protein n=1 Tax=Citrullus colocynthis TaxID=252529 RepID=A0ABP0XR75_9ROSI
MEKQSETGKCEEMEKLCQRCNRSYLPSSNSSFSCRFHPSFFVCRRHDDQKRLKDLFIVQARAWRCLLERCDTANEIANMSSCFSMLACPNLSRASNAAWQRHNVLLMVCCIDPSIVQH